MVAWFMWDTMVSQFRVTGVKVMMIRSKYSRKLRFRRSKCPVDPVQAFPKMWMILSCVQLLMWFVRMIGKGWMEDLNVAIPDTQVMIITGAMLQLAFRKPPDKLIKLTDELFLDVNAGKRCSN